MSEEYETRLSANCRNLILWAVICICFYLVSLFIKDHQKRIEQIEIKMESMRKNDAKR